MNINIAAVLYLAAGILFIMALRGLSSPPTARQGNRYGMFGMGLAVLTTLALKPPSDVSAWIFGIVAVAIGGGIGAWRARTVKMTDMPQLVAAFHALVGLAAVLVAAGAAYAPQAFGIGEPGNIHPASTIEMSIGLASAPSPSPDRSSPSPSSTAAMSGKPILLPQRHFINIALALAIVALVVLFFFSQSHWVFWLIALGAFALGFLIIVPIGGADMPVVVSMLNSYSGWPRRASASRSAISRSSSPARCRLVGRDPVLRDVQGHEPLLHLGHPRRLRRRDLRRRRRWRKETRPVKQGSAEDAAYTMQNASSIIIVPGYGMAVSQAQHALREMGDKLTEAGVEVKYAIHPVAGRMPGHMNVLLAEANVPYDEVYELEDINNEFSQTDVAFVIGANDVTNPAAKTDKSSAIYGMPILDVEKARTVFFLKRGMSSATPASRTSCSSATTR